MNQILIEHLDPTAWKAKPPGKVRTIAAIFTHMHNVRSKWVRLTAPHLKIPRQLNRAHCTPRQARAGLAESAARCEEMLAEALGGCTKATYTVALQEVDRLKALLISSEASEKLAEKKLGDAAIRAPFPGAIKTRNVHPGEYVRVQSPVMVLVRTDRLRARLAVPERWAGWVKDGATVDLHVEAFPGETFQGKISRINPSVAQDSRTFEAEALLANLDGRLKPGFFLQASIPSEKQDKAIFLPERAVNYRYGVYKVFLLNGNRVTERQIRPAGQTEDEHGRRFEVAEGLKPGDRVAVAISGDLHEGSVVQEQSEGTTPAAK